MTNTWGVLLNGYQSQFIREVAGSVKEKADYEVGKSRRYTKKKLEYWSKERIGPGRQTVLKAFQEEKLDVYQITEKYGISHCYVRAVLTSHGLIEQQPRFNRKAVVIIHESGRVKHYDSVELAMNKFGLAQSAFRKHLRKKGNVKFRNGMIAMFKTDYEELGRGNQ